MKFHILTLFPQMVLQGLNTSILARAAENGLISFRAADIREYTQDKHGKADDYPYGGGAGMLMQAQPVYDAYRSVVRNKETVRTIYVTPQGRPFSQKLAGELAQEEELIFLCGHYEGVDERVLNEIVTDYISIGDYVLTGGELPAMVMIDAIARLVPGVLNNGFSAQFETFHNDLLEYPQYTRPAEWKGQSVPEVLLSGDHKAISAWRLSQAIDRTRERRPDLYVKYMEKQDVITWLSKKKRNNIHMIELLKRGHGEVLFAEGNNILLYDPNSKACFLNISEPEKGFHMLDRIPEETKLFVTSQEECNHLLTKHLKAQVICCCYQTVYTRREALPVKNKDIRILDESWVDVIAEYYRQEGREYILGSIRRKTMFGCFIAGELAGFIGIHTEGSMGMLFVREEYRRQGVGESLAAYLINLTKEWGWTPYCHVFTDNLPSIRLQEKMGLYLSDGNIWWLENGAEKSSG